MRTELVLELLSVGDRRHGDLELRLGGARHRCDSYYLSLDRVDAPSESRSKTRRVLAAILHGVAGTVRRSPARSVVLLPYDFSDQYTGLLRLTIGAEGVAIARVVSSVEGWRLDPSRAWSASLETWGELRSWPFASGTRELAMSRPALLEHLKRAERLALRFARPRRARAR
ncbi:MAG: hypothetical protein WKG00_40900 [Polyangiaceae bacterium]